jgi:hypothetical protein
MADRYWVGGSGTWNATTTTNWATSSGGASGASAPTSADNAIFDANSGAAAVVSAAANAVCLGCTVNKSDIEIRLTASGLAIAGTLTLTTGSINLASFNLTAVTTSLNNTNTKSLIGPGSIKLSGTGVLWTPNYTNMTVSGDPLIEFTTNTATSRGFAFATIGATEANCVSFLVSAGTGLVNVTGSVKNLTFANFTGSIGQLAGRNIFGNMELSAGMTFPAIATATVFSATSGIKTIKTNSVLVDAPISFNGAGGSWSLLDALAIGSTRAFTLSAGSFDANSQNVTIGTFALSVGTKTLTLGNGTWTVQGANWNANTNVANLTVSASTGTISMTSASAKAFAGGAKTWPNLNQGGAGVLTIQQANTFANITNTVQPATITFPASTTTTVGAFSASGTSGNLITINSSSAGTRATLSDTSGVNSVSFCSIKDINATGGAFWRSYTSSGNINSGNNLGWDFDDQAFRYIYTRRKNKVILPV